MSDLDLRLDSDYCDNVKIQKLSRRLGDGAVVCHIRLLGYVRKHRPSGVLHGMTPEDVEIVARWTGAPDALSQALISLALIDVAPDQTLSIHDWSTHNLWASESPGRRAHALKKNHERWHLARGIRQPGCSLCESHVTSDTDTRESDVEAESLDGESSSRHEANTSPHETEEVSESADSDAPSIRLVSTGSPARKAKTPIATDSPEYRTATLFRDLLRRHDPHATANLDTWARNLAPMIAKRGVEEVEAAIRFAMTDEREPRFTQSPKALERNFTRIRMAMKATSTPTTTNRPGGRSDEHFRTVFGDR